jgi:outer membrane lipoprotein-sorting protein
VAQTADQVIDRYIAAIGGSAALASVETMRYVRTVFNTDGDVTAQQSRRTIYAKRPFFYRTEDPETGRIYISDGRTAWSGRLAAEEDSVIWSEARVLQSRDLDFDRLFGSFIGFAEKGYVAEYAGRIERKGVHLDVVRVTWTEGDQWEFYFDSATGLCYGMNGHPKNMDDLTRVDDYRRVAGILVPHRNSSIDRLLGGGTRLHERHYSDIAFNVAINESMFLHDSQ